MCGDKKKPEINLLVKDMAILPKDRFNTGEGWADRLVGAVIYETDMLSVKMGKEACVFVSHDLWGLLLQFGPRTLIRDDGDKIRTLAGYEVILVKGKRRLHVGYRVPVEE